MRSERKIQDSKFKYQKEMKTSVFLIMVPGRDDLRVRMSVTLEEDMRFPTPLEVERWEEVPDQVILDGIDAVLRDVDRVDVWSFVKDSQQSDAEIRWQPVEEEPEFAEGWNAYRRELLETVGMTMLPTWEKLPEQVKESWCRGVMVAMGRD
jgi:hypothetical protein